MSYLLMQMEESENALQLRTDCESSGSASPVTGSGQYGDPLTTISNNNEIIQNVAQSNDRDTSVGNVQKRPTSLDFAEQIRRLEIEGNKLRAATVSNVGSSNVYRFDDINNFEVPKFQSVSLGNLSALVDISADQKCISDLRFQLETQKQETERLQKQLLGDVSSLRNIISSHSNSNNSLFSHLNLSPGKSAFTTIANGEMNPVLARHHYDCLPPSHLERSLKESQEQVMELRKKLQQLTESSDQQKTQFRTTIEELKAKLHDTILNRDRVLDLRQKESSSQEQFISKLQSSLTDLQKQYRAQEEVLISTSNKLDLYSHNQHMNETALAQFRSILVEHEKRRGQAYFELEPACLQNVAMLGHKLESCLQELDFDLNMKSCKVLELESSLQDMKSTLWDRERNIAEEFQEKVNLIQVEHEKKLAEVEEKAMVAGQKETAQLKEKELCYQHEVKTKRAAVKELEDKIDELKTDNLKMRAIFQEKRQALEASLDEVQRELIKTSTEKNELILSQVVLESRLKDLQSLVSHHENDLETEHERGQQQRQREEELRSQIMKLEIQVTNKQGDIDRLERMMDMVKQECSAQVVDRVTSAEKLERECFLDQINALSAQLATMTERCSKVTVDHQLAQNEMECLRSQVHDLTVKLEKMRSQMESTLSQKNNLTALLGDKHGDLEQMNHYKQIAEEKADEITELRITVDMLKVQLDEKENVLNMFRQQSSNINHIIEINTKANDNMREEREKMATALTEKTAMLEEIESSQDSLNRKLKAKETRVRELEDEMLKVTKELAVGSQELELLQQERDNIFIELKESRTEVTNLAASNGALMKELGRVRTLCNKEVSKLQAKLKESEQEYRLSQKALRSCDMIDHKVVKFADKMQKEVTIKRSEMDQLMSKLHRLEEKLETLSREKSHVEKDKERLKKSWAKSLLHIQKLTEELNTAQAQNRELLLKVGQLEQELEQATLRVSSSNARAENYEQEIATLKIKHQLNLKEAERLARNKSGSAGSYLTGSAFPSSASGLQVKGHNSDDSGEVLSGCESDVPSTGNWMKMRDNKPRGYSEVGKDLKLLLVEMKNLLSGQGWTTVDGHTKSRPPFHIEDLRVIGKMADKEFSMDTETEKSWASISQSGLADLSDFSSYKEWRPRSQSLTKHKKTHSSDLDFTQGTHFLSRGSCSDISRLSQSMGSIQKLSARNVNSNVIPDTQELCHRLEEKINILTQMGGNLIKENKDVAELIGLQGVKLDKVKQTERKTWESR